MKWLKVVVVYGIVVFLEFVDLVAQKLVCVMLTLELVLVMSVLVRVRWM